MRRKERMLICAALIVSALPAAALLGTGIGVLLNRTASIEGARPVAVVVWAFVIGLAAMGAWHNRGPRRW